MTHILGTARINGARFIVTESYGIDRGSRRPCAPASVKRRLSTVIIISQLANQIIYRLAETRSTITGTSMLKNLVNLGQNRCILTAMTALVMASMAVLVTLSRRAQTRFHSTAAGRSATALNASKQHRHLLAKTLQCALPRGGSAAIPVQARHFQA